MKKRQRDNRLSERLTFTERELARTRAELRATKERLEHVLSRVVFEEAPR